MDLVRGFSTKQHHNRCGGVSLGFNDHFLIIRLPNNAWVLKLVTAALILALFVTLFPCFGSISGGSFLSFNGSMSRPEQPPYESIDMELLPLIFGELANKGLLKMGDRALFVHNGNEEKAIYNSEILSQNGMDLISFLDSERQSSVPDETFDFAFTRGFQSGMEFIDRTLKVGGIATVQLSKNPLTGFEKPSNYKVVYYRRLESTVVALRKTSRREGKSPGKRRLLGVTSSEEKRAALKNLEDVLLEPPRAASGRSKTYQKRTKYLPDLLGDSLESYPRRVFIDVGLPDKFGVGGGGGGGGWFKTHYPTRGKKFEMYKIETVTEESSGKEVPMMIGMSEWLRKNVREEEFVVMKAEAEMVEEMEKNRVLRLVDELFMECKHQGLSGKSKRSRRAYWECLALYGRLRDQGVAVHQWWG